MDESSFLAALPVRAVTCYYLGHSEWSKMKYQSSFNFYTLMAKDVALFCFSAICTSSFKDLLSSVLCLIRLFSWTSVFSSLDILGINPLWDLWSVRSFHSARMMVSHLCCSEAFQLQRVPSVSYQPLCLCYRVLSRKLLLCQWVHTYSCYLFLQIQNSWS